MIFSGQSPNGRLVEIAEVVDHLFMVGHNSSRIKESVELTHPLFHAFISASKANSLEKVQRNQVQAQAEPKIKKVATEPQVKLKLICG